MRVGTWNLQRGGSTGKAGARQLAALETLVFDALVLTEPPADLPLEHSVVSPAERTGKHGVESWVAIIGDGVEPIGDRLPFERLAAAARIDIGTTPVVLYGSVLPWRAAPRHAPQLAQPNESYREMFDRVLDSQVKDLKALRHQYPDHLVIWAGDFNQSLVGPNWTGTTRGRARVIEALKKLSLAAWNADAIHAKPGMCAVDLICGPADQTPHTVLRIDPVVDGHAITDHAGYIVEA